MAKKVKLDKKKLKTNPAYFIEKIIYAKDGFKLTSFQKEWLRLIEDKKRVCMMAFRSSGKTRQLFVHYFLWKALINPNTQYLIISRTLPQAIEVLKDIRLTLVTNPLLKSFIPKNKSRTWSRTELEFSNHSRILSKAYNENVRGLHVDGVGCVTKETSIITSKGVKNINEVSKGDYVLTHKNRFKKVLETSERKWRGKIYEIVTERGIKIRITGEHPFLVKSGSHKKWKRADRIKMGDYLNIPETGTNPVINFDNNKRWFRVTPILAQIMGYYVAEGSYMDGIRFSSSMPVYQSILKTFFGKCSRYKNHTIFDYVVHDRALGKAFRNWFGNSSLTKKIPPFIFRSSRKVQTSFLVGLFDGDGHYSAGACDYTTSSLQLYNDVKQLCDLVGFKFSEYNSKFSPLSSRENYRLRVPVQSMCLLRELFFSKKRGAHIEVKVKEINTKKSHSYVYNLKVDEDNSYCGNGLSLHNCDELGTYENHEIFKKAVLPTIRAKRGFFVGIGTPLSELDLLHEIEQDPGFSSIYFDRYPAESKEKGNLFEIRYPDTAIVHKDGAVHITDKKTGKTIETYNHLTWSQEFLLKPVSTEDKLFPPHMVQACLDPSSAFQMEPVNMKQYFMGCDFAMSAQSGADYTVITILEKSPGSKKLKIVWIERFKGLDYRIQKERIVELAERYQITKALGDENTFGKVFIYDLKAAGIPIEGFKFSSTNRSKDEIIKALRDQFEKEGFIIPYSREDVKTTLTVKKLMEELNAFGILFDMRSKTVKFEGLGRHDDMVVSLGLANFIARHISMGLFSVVKGMRKSGNNPFIVK